MSLKQKLRNTNSFKVLYISILVLYFSFKLDIFISSDLSYSQFINKMKF
ncbi:hypothetical protein HMPREF6123_1072 [Oribacterium sinus F0268]|uniref:Uncharacterized protein n=1 Tax=Oribacterium sinus F0268 TaxID=585501 RepID=C2KX53_9FIRM|nr:hypothetical protein HMPREF6123_1072 [Oribacterium sinus F0268]